MPSGSIAVISFLALGYVLFIVELVVPGGILGILGFLSVAYGCYIAFELGPAWGAGSIGGSLAVFAFAIYFMLRSKTGRHMMLADENQGGTWKSADQSLSGLLGAEGVAATPLRPAGMAHFGERRVDVVSDSEFLSSGTRLRVIEVEGMRVVVEAAPDGATPESEAAGPPAGDAAPDAATSPDAANPDAASPDAASSDTASSEVLAQSAGSDSK